MVDFSSHSELNEKRWAVLNSAISAPIFGVDTETTGLKIKDGTDFCIGISIAFRDSDGNMQAAYYPVAHEKNNIPDEMKKQLYALLLTRELLIMHNAKFDIVSLATAGINIMHRNWICTMIMTHFMNENIPIKSLDFLSKLLLKVEGKKKGPDWEWAFSVFGWSAAFPSEIMDAYATEDAILPYNLWEKGYPEFKAAGFDGI